MNSKFIEGYLQLKLDGYWYIDSYKLKEGTLLEFFQNEDWVLVSIEYAHGTFYFYPQNQIAVGNKARFEVDQYSDSKTESNLDISAEVNKAFMTKLKTRLGDR